MGGNVFKKSPLDTLRGVLGSALFTLAVTAAALMGLRQTELSSRAEGRHLLEESLRAAALRCYVVEGSYPGSAAYIEEHYGVRIDRARYAVFYEIYAPNLMPEITVTELEGARRQ